MKSKSWQQPEDWEQFIEGKYCPFAYRPCKWPNEVGCVLEHIPCRDTKEKYIEDKKKRGVLSFFSSYGKVSGAVL